MPSRRIAVLGAGPIGLEAALALLENGHDVRVYERDRVGGNVSRWGHVRLFSPFAMNHSGRGAELLKGDLPDEDAYLTGAEYVERYLEPLVRKSPLGGRVREGTEALYVGRDGIGKNELVGGPRDRHPFRLLLQGAGGAEEVVIADVVVDCTGTYGNPNWLGNGNLPAVGERSLRARISYELRDVSGRDRERFEGRRVLLVGGGHSAASALDDLQKLSGTSVEWAIRKRRPLEVVENDPLPERKRLSELAQRIAAGAEPRVRFHPKSAVTAIAENGAGLEVELQTPDGPRHLEVDEILAHVGCHPESRLYRELQVHECYASLAPMKLAAALLGDGSSDCLAQTSKGPDTLRNPEPDFFILGSKSYGKNSQFLVRIGLSQIEELLALLNGRVEEKAS